MDESERGAWLYMEGVNAGRGVRDREEGASLRSAAEVAGEIIEKCKVVDKALDCLEEMGMDSEEGVTLEEAQKWAMGFIEGTIDADEDYEESEG